MLSSVTRDEWIAFGVAILAAAGLFLLRRK
jgi:LPXTG-motif cell wall-anchored protein